MRRFLLLALPLPALAAEPGTLGVGVGAAVVADLPDAVSGSHTRFGPGPGLVVPLRYRVAPMARLRLTPRVDFAAGTDRVRWVQEIDGQPTTFYADGHWAGRFGVSLTGGADLFLPVDTGPVAPYLGAELGGAWVTTWHSFDGPSRVLLDPEQNDLDNPRNVDPYTTQATFLTAVHAGAELAVSEGLALWLETGYSVAFLNARPLEKTPPELQATRDPYGWNAFRVGAGVVFRL